MNNEEKIIALLERHSELLERHSVLLEKLNDRMDQMQESQAQMQGDIASLQSGQAQMQGNINRINARLDYDVDTRLKAMADGQAAIEEHLSTVEGSLAEVKELSESTADKVDIIHAVVTQHSASIAKLKKA